MNSRQIIDYYDQTEIDYRLVWHLNSQMAMHYGFWDDSAKNFKQALQRENEVLSQIVKIKKSDKVLDAGCGVGGSAIFLAKRYGCRVVGITLSKQQTIQAYENAIRHKVDHLTEFKAMDFNKTSFERNIFDVVWAVESVCHALDKKEFIKEACRILRRGGRLILADFFASQDRWGFEEEKVMSSWLKGWSLESLESMDRFQRLLKEAGFKNIISKNMTEKIRPSAKRMYAYFFPGLVIGWGLKLLGLRSKVQNDNIRAAYYQYQALKRNLWEYGIFYAQK